MFNTCAPHASQAARPTSTDLPRVYGHIPFHRFQYYICQLSRRREQRRQRTVVQGGILYYPSESEGGSFPERDTARTLYPAVDSESTEGKSNPITLLISHQTTSEEFYLLSPCPILVIY
jgi:hypothetical protein